MQPAYSCPATFYKRFERKDGNQETTHYCPGCGHGIVHRLVCELLEEYKVSDNCVFMAPVGCSILAYTFLSLDVCQPAHGRTFDDYYAELAARRRPLAQAAGQPSQIQRHAQAPAFIDRKVPAPPQNTRPKKNAATSGRKKNARTMKN